MTRTPPTNPRQAHGSIGVGTDDLAAIAGGELLPDPEPGRRAKDHVVRSAGTTGVIGVTGDRHPGRESWRSPRVGPGIDRFLDEPNRAVAQGDIRPARMLARDRDHDVRRVGCGLLSRIKWDFELAIIRIKLDSCVGVNWDTI